MTPLEEIESAIQKLTWRRKTRGWGDPLLAYLEDAQTFALHSAATGMSELQIREYYGNSLDLALAMVGDL